eukprot:1160632-Pelagomonas_calceolata.AAC.10
MQVLPMHEHIARVHCHIEHEHCHVLCTHTNGTSSANGLSLCHTGAAFFANRRTLFWGHAFVRSMPQSNDCHSRAKKVLRASRVGSPVAFASSPEECTLSWPSFGSRHLL